MNFLADFIARFVGPILARFKVTNPIGFLLTILGMISLYWGIPVLVGYVGANGQPLVSPSFSGILNTVREVLFAVALFLNVDLRSPGIR